MCANTVGEFPAVCSRFCFVAEGSKGWPNIRTASLQSCTPAAIPDRWNYRTLKEFSYFPGNYRTRLRKSSIVIQTMRIAIATKNAAK